MVSVPGLTLIDYTVAGTVGQAYSIDFFASGTPGGPAAVFLGTATTPPLTSATQSFGATFNLATPLASGQSVTATATDANNNTSAFATAAALTPPFLVTNTNDGGIGSLRQAIVNANHSPNATITFAITGTGPFVINTVSAMPNITAPVTIDGTSEPGYAFGTAMVELDGASSGGGDGLVLAGVAPARAAARSRAWTSAGSAAVRPSASNPRAI